MRTTYTFAELEVSKEAYDEIAKKLKAAQYDHVLVPNGTENPTINMHGIGLTIRSDGVPRCGLCGNALHEHGGHRDPCPPMRPV